MRIKMETINFFPFLSDKYSKTKKSKRKGRITVINTDYKKNRISYSNTSFTKIQEEANKSLQWNTGDILEGIVTGHTEEKVHIDIQGQKIQARWNQSIMPEIGTILSFQVEKKAEGTISLQLISAYQKNTNTRKIQGLQTISFSISDPLSKKQIETESRSKNTQGQALQYVTNTLTEEDQKELTSSNYNIEKMTPEELAHWLQNQSEKDSKAAPSEEEIQTWAEKLVQEKGLAGPNDWLNEAIAALLKEGLPITVRNVQSLMNLGQRLETIRQMPLGKVAQLVEQPKSTTINTWYQQQHRGEGDLSYWKAQNPYEQWEEEQIKNKYPLEDIEFDEEEWLQKEITRIFQREQITDNKENQIRAISLAQSGIAITKENIQTIKEYEKYQEQMKDHPEYYLEQGARQIKKGESIGDISLQYWDTEEMNIPSISDSSLSFIQAKLQLAELQLKMTTEATQKLGQKINIDINPLKELVEELRILEKENQANTLRQVGITPTEEKIDLMTQVQETKVLLQLTNRPLIGEYIQSSTLMELETIEALGEKAIELYDTMRTQPENRFGETLFKVQDQIEHVLEQNNISPTPTYIRGATILIHNQIPITEENLNEVKILDQKLQSLIRGLHPVLVAHMIKDEINPMKSTLDDILKYMDQFEQWKGFDVSDHLSRYILDMDQANVLDANQRESLMGIYRMLYTIQGREGAALGHLYKNNLPLTLGNLMEAAHYLENYQSKNKNQFDHEINDEFGFLEELERPEGSIKEQIETGFKNIEDPSKKNQLQQRLQKYELKVLQDYMKTANSNKLLKIVEQPKWEEVKIEDFNQLEEEKLQTSSTLDSEFIHMIQEEESISLEGMKTSLFPLLEQYDLSPTLENLQTIHQMASDPFYLGRTLEQLNQQLQQTLAMPMMISNINQDSSQRIEELQTQLYTIKKESISLPKKERKSLWKSAKEVEQGLKVQQQIQNKDNFYQIPIQLHDRISQLNIYVMDEEKGQQSNQDTDNMRIWFSLETTALGKIGMHMLLEDKKVQFQVYAEQEETLNYLQKQSPKLQQALQQMGYKVSPILYDIQKIQGTFQQVPEPILTFQQRKIGNGSFETIG